MDHATVSGVLDFFPLGADIGSTIPNHQHCNDFGVSYDHTTFSLNYKIYSYFYGPAHEQAPEPVPTHVNNPLMVYGLNHPIYLKAYQEQGQVNWEINLASKHHFTRSNTSCFML